jgi:hypothetical protein
MTSPVEVCESLLGAHLHAAERVFGSAALGLVDLPPLSGGRLVPAQIGIAAVLYYCRELESAGLLPFLEVLSARFASGEVALDFGRAGARLAALTRRGNQRFSAPERRALYARVLDGSASDSAPAPGDAGVTARLRGLARAAAEIGRRRRDQGVVDLQVRVAAIARDLAQELSDRAVGMAGFAAREIVTELREALAILADPSVARSLGGGTPWAILRRHAPSLIGRSVDVARHTERAAAGLQLLRFVAASAGDLDGSARRLAPEHALIRAAERWLSVDSEDA